MEENGDTNDVKAREALDNFVSNFTNEKLTPKHYDTPGVPNSNNPELKQLVKDDYYIHLPNELKGKTQLKQLKNDLARELTIQGKKIPAAVLDQYIKDHDPLPEPLKILITQHNQVPTYSIGNIFRYALVNNTTALNEVLSFQFNCDTNFDTTVKTAQHSDYESVKGKVLLTTHYHHLECIFVEQGSDKTSTVAIPINVEARFEVNDEGNLLCDLINNTEDKTIAAMVDECIHFNKPKEIKKSLYNSIGKTEMVVERNNKKIEFLNRLHDVVSDEGFWKNRTPGFKKFPDGVAELSDDINKYLHEEKKFPNDSYALNTMLSNLKVIAKDAMKPRQQTFFGRKPVHKDAKALYEIILNEKDANVSESTVALESLVKAEKVATQKLTKQ